MGRILDTPDLTKSHTELFFSRRTDFRGTANIQEEEGPLGKRRCCPFPCEQVTAAVASQPAGFLFTRHQSCLGVEVHVSMRKRLYKGLLVKKLVFRLKYTPHLVGKLP